MLPGSRRNRVLGLLAHSMDTLSPHREVRLLRVIARQDESNNRDTISGSPVPNQGMSRARVVSIMLPFVGKLPRIFKSSVDTVNLVPEFKDFIGWRKLGLVLRYEMKSVLA